MRRLLDGGTAVWIKDHPFGDTVGNLLTVVPARGAGWWTRTIVPASEAPIDLGWHPWKEGQDITDVLKATARWYPKGLYFKAPSNVSCLTSDSIFFGFPGIFEESLAGPQSPKVGENWTLNGWYLRTRGPILHPQGLSLRVYPPKAGPRSNRMLTVEFRGTGPDDQLISEEVSLSKFDGDVAGKATRTRFKTLTSVKLLRDQADPSRGEEPPRPPLALAISGTEAFHFLEGARPFTMRLKDNPEEKGLLFFLIDAVDVRIGGPKLKLSFHGGVEDLSAGRYNPLDKIGTWALQVPHPRRYPRAIAWGMISLGRFGAGILGERFDFHANASHSYNCINVAIEAAELGKLEEGIRQMTVGGHWKDGMLNARNMRRDGLTEPLRLDDLILESTTDPSWDGSDFRRKGVHGWGVRNSWPMIAWWEKTGLNTVEHQIVDWQPVGGSGKVYAPAKGLYPGCWAYKDPGDPSSPLYIGGGSLFEVLVQSRGKGPIRKKVRRASGQEAEENTWEPGDDLSQITFRIEGSDDRGRDVSREIAGPRPDEVTMSDRVFKTVTRVSAVRVPAGQEGRTVAMTRSPRMVVRMMDPPRVGGNRTPMTGRIVLRGGKTGLGVFNMDPNVDTALSPDDPGLTIVFDHPGEILGTDTMMGYLGSIYKQDGTSKTTATRRVKYTFTQTPQSSYAPRWLYQAGGTGASFQHATFVYDHFKGSLHSLGCDSPRQIIGDIEHTGTIDHATFLFPDPPEEKGPSTGQASGLVVYGRSRAHDVVAPQLRLQDFSSRFQALRDTLVEDLTVLPARRFPEEEGKIHLICPGAHPSISDEPVATNVVVRRVRFSDGAGGLAPPGDRILIHRWNARPIGLGGQGPLVFSEIKAAAGSRIVLNWRGQARLWTDINSYLRYDVVTREGKLFFCTRSHSPQRMFDPALWAPFDPSETNLSLQFNGRTVTRLPYTVP